MPSAKIDWFEAVNQLKKRGDGFVLITILGVLGSAPRDSGTKMVVSGDTIYGTIGGGHLEFKSLAIAHKMLNEQLGKQQGTQHIEHFSLGASLGQCCGGSTSVLFESFAACATQIMLFGAGHVGKALTQILADLPCQVKWVDNRSEQFPAHSAGNIEMIVSESPVAEIAKMPAASYFLIMTHNHQLDFELCQALLKRNDFAYVGLIGSQTKWKRFVQRLGHRDFVAPTINKITCPVGASSVPGKRPMEVAVSIAAELIALYQAAIGYKQGSLELNSSEQVNSQQEKGATRKTSTSSNQGISWRELKPLLVAQE
jgi:xanthine dehydrogenase accessory factor